MVTASSSTRSRHAWNATSHYTLLRKNVLDARNGNAAAKAVVTDSVTQTRQGFAPLIPLGAVAKLYTTLGST